jgi:hypothetical protein
LRKNGVKTVTGTSDQPKERAMPSESELLERLYDRVNARDMEAALATIGK